LLDQYKDLFGRDRQMHTVLALIYEDILMFHAKALCFFTGKGMWNNIPIHSKLQIPDFLGEVWQKVFRAMWKNFDSRFKRILDSLSQHRQMIAEQAQLLFQRQYVRDRNEMLNFVLKYRQNREKNIEDRERQMEADARRSHREVLQWFSAADTTASDQQNFTNIRNEYAGTGYWILENEKVKNWREAETPMYSMLWMSGKPGAGMRPNYIIDLELTNLIGKTILTSVVIESLLASQEFVTAFFYCNEEDPRKNDGISVLRALLSQLLCGCPLLIPFCQERYYYVSLFRNICHVNTLR